MPTHSNTPANCSIGVCIPTGTNITEIIWAQTQVKAQPWWSTSALKCADRNHLKCPVVWWRKLWRKKPKAPISVLTFPQNCQVPGIPGSVPYQLSANPGQQLADILASVFYTLRNPWRGPSAAAPPSRVGLASAFLGWEAEPLPLPRVGPSSPHHSSCSGCAPDQLHKSHAAHKWSFRRTGGEEQEQPLASPHSTLQGDSPQRLAASTARTPEHPWGRHAETHQTQWVRTVSPEIQTTVNLPRVSSVTLYWGVFKERKETIAQGVRKAQESIGV